MTQIPPHPEQPLDLVCCHECDAAVPAANRYCWLCGHQMDSPFKGRMAVAPAAIAIQGKKAAASDPTRDLVLNVSLGAVALMLVLMTAAVWAQEPVFGVALAFVLAPPLVITLIGGLISRLSGQVMTPAKRVLLFVKSAVVTFAAAVVMGAIAVIVTAVVIVGLIIALFQECFKMLGWRVMHAINWTYAGLMFAALVTCGLLLRRSQGTLPLSAMQKLGIGIGAFCGAMIGAKLPFVLSDWDGLVSGQAWLQDGKTIMCGIVGGYFGVVLAKWALDVQVKTGDSFAAPVAVAVAIGRLACFTGGCCYGTPTDLPWGVVFANSAAGPDGSLVPRHPTQLYEAAFHLTAAALLVWLGHRGIFKGQLIKLYILCYLVYRFLTELIRPEAQLWLGLTGYQWACLALVPVFVGLWWRDAKALKSLYSSTSWKASI